MKVSTGAASPHDVGKRRLLVFAASGMGIVGVSGFLWVLGDSLNPAAGVVTPELFTVSNLPQGQWRGILWRGTLVIVHHRTQAQIMLARSTAQSALYPESEDIRSHVPAWFVAVGMCTFRGCELIAPTEYRRAHRRKGWFWFCPRCGSEYDLSGRAMIGPAPRNLDLLQYEFDHAGEL